MRIVVTCIVFLLLTPEFSGKVVLCVLPSTDLDPLHAVKWHPQHPDLVAVTSESHLYLINIEDVHHSFGGEPIPQSELHRVSQIFTIPTVSYVVALDIIQRLRPPVSLLSRSTLTSRAQRSLLFLTIPL